MEQGTEEERWLKEQHLRNNTFENESGTFLEEQDGGRKGFIEGDEVRVVVVKIKDGRVSDWKGAVRDWTLVEGASNGV